MKRQLLLAILWATVAVLAFLSLWGYFTAPVEPTIEALAPARAGA